MTKLEIGERASLLESLGRQASDFRAEEVCIRNYEHFKLD